MRGYPLARSAARPVTVCVGPRLPDRSTRRTSNCALPLLNSIHVAYAVDESTSATPTWPSDPASSRRIGAPNVATASPENAEQAWPCSLSAVIHETATSRSRALIARPFTGHASLFQDSA